MSRSVNLAIIIGNLTRDPEMRYTPGGHAVTSFGVATNRSWVSDGVQKEETEFHNVVAWNKLAELCAQLLGKGKRVYVQGRLQTRTWEGSDGVRRSKTEIVADEMIILEPPPRSAAGRFERDKERAQVAEAAQSEEVKMPQAVQKEAEEDLTAKKKTESEEITVEDIPF